MMLMKIALGATVASAQSSTTTTTSPEPTTIIECDFYGPDGDCYDDYTDDYYSDEVCEIRTERNKIGNSLHKLLVGRRDSLCCL